MQQSLQHDRNTNEQANITPMLVPGCFKVNELTTDKTADIQEDTNAQPTVDST